MCIRDRCLWRKRFLEKKLKILSSVLRRKVPIGYNSAPQIRPKTTPSRGSIPKPHYTCLIPGPSDLWCQTASGSDPPFCHNALDRPTDRPTHLRTNRPTDRPQKSLTTLGRCAPRATRPKIVFKLLQDFCSDFSLQFYWYRNYFVISKLII